MELIKSASRRSHLSEAVYIALNLVYAILVWALVVTFDPPYIAYGVVALSKWRVFAVRPRFWFVNLQANLIDTLFGISIVTLLWLNIHSVAIQAVLVAIFAVWLVLLKPRSKQRFMIFQAGLTLFISLTALFSFAYAVPSVVIVVACWIIGYATARHVLSSYNNEHERVLLALIWSLIVAELGWLGYHWTVAYGLNESFKLPQIAVVITLVGFIVAKAYGLYHHSENGKIDMKVLRWPLLFVILTLGILLLRFNGLNPT